jgi:hypothetical protein
MEVAALSPVEKVLCLWNNVWSYPYNLDLIDELMVEDFVITNAGKEIRGRDNFKQWVVSFLGVLSNCHLENIDIFESKDGSKVVSRWKLTGFNNGLMGLEPCQRAVEMTGTAVWLIRDNKLAHNWVERSAWELYQQLTQ